MEAGARPATDSDADEERARAPDDARAPGDQGARFTLPPTRVEPSPRWVRAELAGRTIGDTRRAMLHLAFGPPLLPGTERPLLPGYFFPFEDVDMDVLTPAGVRDGRHWWHADVDGTHVEHAAWTYDEPTDATADLAGHLTFRWEVMDAWYEEAEQVFVHARDPHKRVDVIGSTRHVQVVIDGLVLADTHEPFLLFETHLPTRYYLPPRDVRTDLLVDSRTVTACPYKGVAQHWSLDGAGDAGRDIAWSYPDPVPEQPRLANLICFYNEKVDVLVDGELQERPVTPWS
jgi:uncharacterized protein (DUF427 family)